jgi:hypothetical protein
MRSPCALLLFLAAASTGCDLPVLAVDLQVPALCVDGLDVAFPPGGADLGLTERSLSIDDLAADLPDDVELDVAIISTGLIPDDGMGDLGFLDRLGIRMAPVEPADGLPEISLVELDRDDHEADGAMRAAPSDPIDIAAYLEETEVVFAFEIDGDLPAEAWRGHMDLCVQVRARYRVGL